jgi:hypothetical protein
MVPWSVYSPGPGAIASISDRHMGFILQKVLYTTSPGKQIGHMRAHSAALAGLAVTSRPGLNLPHRLDRQASTCTHRTHRLPAAGAGRGTVLRRGPGCPCRGLATPQHVRSPPLHVWSRLGVCADTYDRQVSTCGRTLSRSARSGLALLAHIVSPWYWVWHTCARPSPSTRRCHATLSAPIMTSSNCP